jgi:hypothetical protein
VYLAKVTRAAMAEIRGIARADTKTHGRLRDTLVALLVVSVMVDLICAFLILMLERHAQHTQVETYGSALFWTSTQLLTVSSQLQNPISVGARILDIAMEGYAITVVATLAGSMGAFLIRRAHEVEREEAGKRDGGPAVPPSVPSE